MAGGKLHKRQLAEIARRSARQIYSRRRTGAVRSIHNSNCRWAAPGVSPHRYLTGKFRIRRQTIKVVHHVIGIRGGAVGEMVPGGASGVRLARSQKAKQWQ